MAFIEQVCVSLKGKEIEVWNRLRQMYPGHSKHDVILYAICALLNKNKLKRARTWKELRRFYPDVKSDWLFMDKIMKERLGERYNQSLNH